MRLRSSRNPRHSRSYLRKVKSLPSWTAKHETQVLHSKFKLAIFRKTGVFGQTLVSLLLNRFERRLEEQAEPAREVERLKRFA
jgi:hypothetical protein